MDGWMDVTLSQLFLKPIVEGLVFCLGHWVDITPYGIGYSLLEVNGMIS